MSDKQKNILKWINEQGYPFEMFCKNMLSKHGFSVVQSPYYEDMETSKFREMDFLATKFKIVNGVTFNISLVIECKTSRDKPWIIFTSNAYKGAKDEIPEYIFGTTNAKVLLNNAPIIKEFSLLRFNPKAVGFNVTQCFTQGKDIPFECVSNTSKACEYLVKKSIESYRPFCNFYFPVVAIDAEFYNCSSNSESELELTNTDIQKLITVKSYSRRKYTLHNLVTKTKFEEFSKKLSIEIDQLFENINSQMITISIEHPGNLKPPFG